MVEWKHPDVLFGLTQVNAFNINIVMNNTYMELSSRSSF
jgi:hypothetical protein